MWSARLPDCYSQPQVAACFIQSVEDDLMDLAAGIQREMRLFKFGSGHREQLLEHPRRRSEPLTSGGTSSGLMSFLEIFDQEPLGRSRAAAPPAGRPRWSASTWIIRM